MRIERRIIIGLIVLTSPAAARGQVSNPFTVQTYTNPFGSYLGTLSMTNLGSRMTMNSIRAQYGLRDAGAAGPVLHAPSASAVAEAPLQVSDFRPVTRRRILLDEYLLEDPDGAPASEQLVTMYRASFAEIEKQGRKNNVAFGMAVAIAASVQILTGRDVPWAEVRRLTRSINNMLATNPDFQALAPLGRQQLYEASIITAAAMLGAWAIAVKQNDEATKEAARALARSTLAQFGLAGRSPSS